MKMNFNRSLMMATALHALLLISIVAYSSHLAQITPESGVREVEVSLVAEEPVGAKEAPPPVAKLIVPATPQAPPPKVPKPVSMPTPVIAPDEKLAVGLVAPPVPIPLATTPQPVFQAASIAQTANALPEPVPEGSSVNSASDSTTESDNNVSQMMTDATTKGIITELIPRKGKSPAPYYPGIARRMRHEGVVVLQVRVNQQGKPVNVEVKQSSGFAELDESAVQTVRWRWEFEPKMVNGFPVEEEAEQSVQFMLKK